MALSDYWRTDHLYRRFVAGGHTLSRRWRTRVVPEVYLMVMQTLLQAVQNFISCQFVFGFCYSQAMRYGRWYVLDLPGQPARIGGWNSSCDLSDPDLWRMVPIPLSSLLAFALASGPGVCSTTNTMCWERVLAAAARQAGIERYTSSVAAIGGADWHELSDELHPKLIRSISQALQEI